jgi:hypothetical protein
MVVSVSIQGFENQTSSFFNPIKYRIYLLNFIFLLVNALPTAAQGPTPSQEWMLKELLRDSTIESSILHRNYGGNKLMFWPEDMKVKAKTPQEVTQSIIKNKNGFFLMIEGTGRVYRMKLMNEQVHFTRIDSTLYDGYNFSALNFSFRDTLYSLGGYGLWQHNGQLRYYNQSTHGWELMPINRKIEITINHLSFYDIQDNMIYAIGIEKFEHQDSGLKKTGGLQKKNILSVYRLDLTRKDWTHLGTFLPQLTPKLGELPWGYLVATGTSQSSKFFLADFKNNRLLSLKNTEKNNALYDAYFSGEVNPAKESLIYYHDSALVILTDQKKRFTFPLTLADFTDTGERIYEPAHILGIPRESLTWLGAAGAIVLLSSFAFVGLKRQAKRIQPLGSSPDRSPFIDAEIAVINMIHQHAEGLLKAEDLDDILNTTKKSRDVQNQRRSSILRSINTKYTLITSDEEPLITTERMELDRRMIQYVLNKEKFEKVKHLFRFT